MDVTEALLEELQSGLDAGKSQEERNKMGQYATPFALTRQIMSFAKRYVNDVPVSFLEPSIGIGNFYMAFKSAFQNDCGHALGFETDSEYFKTSLQVWRNDNIELRNEDFLEASPGPDESFDLLVANPPYVRHHHIERGRKIKLQQQVRQEYGINISGLAGLYCYFLILASKWLSAGALSCWLIPCEFMDVNYGRAVKQFLLEKVELMQIHRFRPDDLQFPDALVSSCVVIFRNNPPSGKAIMFSQGECLLHPQSVITINPGTLNADVKWSGLFSNKIKLEERLPVLGDFFRVKRGIATGCNDFFIVDQHTVYKYEIPSLFLKPVLPSPRYVTGDIILSDEGGNPVFEKKLFLFSCNVEEEKLKAVYPKVWQYVLRGREKGVDNGYICSRRKPWYSCEERFPAPLVVPYMGRRGESAGRMFRFIRNTSLAVTTNVYLLLYPLDGCLQSAKDKRDLLDMVWEKLNNIAAEKLISGGRVYGGGLYKIEPQELMNIPVPELASILKPSPKVRQLSLF